MRPVRGACTLTLNQRVDHQQFIELQNSNHHLIADMERENLEGIIAKLATYYEPYGLKLESILENREHTWRCFADQKVDEPDSVTEEDTSSTQDP